MALTATGSIFVDEGLGATDSNPQFRNPLLEVTWTTLTDNAVQANLRVLNTGGELVRAQAFAFTQTEINGVTITTSTPTTSQRIREAVEKLVRDRLNTLNGSTVITWS